jgi:hypothetical protein
MFLHVCLHMSRHSLLRVHNKYISSILPPPMSKEFVIQYYEVALLKGQCHEIFCFWFFFHESVSPQPQSIPLGPFQKFTEIFACQGAPSVSTAPAANFATSFASVVDTGGKFATGVNDIGGKFATGVNDTGGK